jgi:hypothetical protein
MSQSDFNIQNVSRSLFRSQNNAALQALASQNSGATEPATKYAYQIWADTTSGILKMRNAANNAWINLFTMSTGLLAQLDGMNLTGALNEKRSTIAVNATTTPIWTTASGNILDVTGTATITNFPAAPQAGARRIAYFAAGTILTDNANIDVEGDANYTIVAGDRVEIEALTTTTFKAWISKKTGAPVLGSNSINQGNTSVVITDAGTGKIEQTVDGVIIGELTTAARRSTIDGGSTLYPEYKNRAWVNFNGTGVIAIRGSGNVTSITDNGTGSYTVNFTTALPDTNYGFTFGGGLNARFFEVTAKATNSITINHRSSAGTLTDIDEVCMNLTR